MRHPAVQCAVFCAAIAFAWALASSDTQCLQRCVVQAASNNSDAAQACAKAVDVDSIRCVCSSEVLINAMGSCVHDNCDAKVEQYFQQQCAGLQNAPTGGALAHSTRHDVARGMAVGLALIVALTVHF